MEGEQDDLQHTKSTIDERVVVAGQQTVAPGTQRFQEQRPRTQQATKYGFSKSTFTKFTRSVAR